MANDWRRFIPRFARQARRTIGNPKKLREMLTKAYAKADKHRTSLEAVWQDLQTMLRLVRAWTTGGYRQISPTTLVAIIGAVAYFLSPFDAVLDVIPMLGFIDDAAVIGFVVSQVRNELTAFRGWEEQRLLRLKATDDVAALEQQAQ